VIDRAAMKPTLALVRRMVLARETGKAGFLLAMDGIRAGARACGATLAAAGVLDQAEDVFFLTLEELLDDARCDRRAQIADRRAHYARYLEFDLPESWQGNPVPVPIASRPDRDDDVVEGVGVSPGVTTGPARVVHRLDDDLDFVRGEILVCRITDPSWAPLMALASGLAIDIGGPLSHGAIVARELGVPCVINTKTGTAAVSTGDVVELDGDTGRLRIVQRSADRRPASAST
jgi:pyruvate,water dikinase